MTDAFLAFAKEFGPAVAVCGAVAAFLLWWVKQQIERLQDSADKREAYLSRRLDEVQDSRMDEMQAFNAKLVEVVTNNTKAFEMLQATVAEWQGRPCLYEKEKAARAAGRAGASCPGRAKQSGCGTKKEGTR